jgi:hypothetical protein
MIFSVGILPNNIAKLSYVYVFGDDLRGIGGVTLNINAPLPRAGAYLIRVYTRVRDTWQIRVEVVKNPT